MLGAPKDSVMLKEVARHIAKVLVDEYLPLILEKSPHHLHTDMIATLLGLVFAYEFYDASIHTDMLVAFAAQVEPGLLSIKFRARDLIEYYKVVHPCAMALKPQWLLPIREHLTEPQMLKH